MFRNDSSVQKPDSNDSYKLRFLVSDIDSGDNNVGALVLHPNSGEYMLYIIRDFYVFKVIFTTYCVWINFIQKSDRANEFYNFNYR